MKNLWGRAAFLAALSVVVLSTQNCYYDNEAELYPNGSACDTAQVRYSVEVDQILTNANCYVCHSDAANNGGVSIEGYQKLKASVDNGTLMGSIRWESNYSAMPKNANKLTDCEIQKLEKWVADGAPDN